MIAFLVLIFLAFATNVFAAESNNSVSDSAYQSDVANNIVIELIKVTQSNIDRSISILNLVGTMMAILVALITFIFIVGGYLGIKSWKEISDKMQKHLDNSKKNAQLVDDYAQKAKPLFEMLNRMKDEVNSRNDLVLQSLSNKLPEKLEHQLGEFRKNKEIIEVFDVPLGADGYMKSAIDYFYSCQYELALDAINKALAINPLYPEAWDNKGIILGKFDLKASLNAFDKAIKINPNLSRAWNNKGIILSNYKMYDEALEAFERAVSIQSDFAEAWNNKGISLIKLNLPEKALEAFDMAIQIKHEFAEAKENREIVLKKLNQK